MATSANLTFIPWVRQGAASAIAVAEAPGVTLRGVIDLEAALRVNGQPAASLNVRLRGPADVVGIDPNEIVRVEPRPGTRDFEPNYFPCVEFDRPDFPWLFTPARADANGCLRPWLCLVVVRVQGGVVLQPATEGRLPVLEIGTPARPADELPDLGDASFWAHAQTAGDVATVGQALGGRPELSLSRLLCPRLLAAETDYIACLVPTFEIGRRAGLNDVPTEEDVTGPNGFAPAWTSTPPPTHVKLPVYYSWPFRTGAGGDFESLVRLLHAEPAPERLGLRAVDISRPGFPLPASVPQGATVDVEGALQPMERPEAPAPWMLEIAAPFQSGLADIINAPGVAAATDPADDPLLAPPLYGRYHAARTTVATGDGATWFDQLNLDPRNRVVGAFGTCVVQDHQEALMAAAWEQAGDLQQANERVRRLQLSMVVNASLHVRHFDRLDEDALLRVSAPAFARLRGAAGPAGFGSSTVLATVRASMVPVQAISAPMRRIGRQRGPLSRRVVSQGATRFATGTWVGVFNTASPTVPESPRFNLATFSAVRRRVPLLFGIRSYVEVTADAIAETPGRPGFQIAREGQPVPVRPVENLPASADDAAASAFRSAAHAHLARLNPGRVGVLVAPPPPLRLGDLRATLIGQTRPQVTITALARAMIAVGPNATSPVSEPDAATARVETIMTAPSFRQPMYEALRDLGQELLLPGLEGITANTVLGLKTNRRFVEAYMVGLNVEMARELLWRGFPTDERGTYFEQFWDARTAPGRRPDVSPIHDWRDRRLGAADGAPTREQFVLLLRSDLLRRYPTAVIYATPARVSNGIRSLDEEPEHELHPVFRGSMDPDVSFFGFDMSTADMVRGNNGAGHYIIIQEQPTEPRFGLDVGTPVGDATHLRVKAGPPAGLPLSVLEWGRNGAHMAGITRQLPVRIAIHASRFVRA